MSLPRRAGYLKPLFSALETQHWLSLSHITSFTIIRAYGKCDKCQIFSDVIKSKALITLVLGTLLQKQCAELVKIFVNLTQTGFIWKDGISMEKLVCRQICRAFSWLMIDVGGPSPLQVLPPLSKGSWVVRANCRGQTSKQSSSMVSASGPDLTSLHKGR